MDYIEYYTKHPLYFSTIRKRGIIRIIKFKLYFDERITEKFDFSTDMFQTVQPVYIKTILTKAGNQVPIIKEIELSYRYESIEVL